MFSDRHGSEVAANSNSQPGIYLSAFSVNTHLQNVEAAFRTLTRS